MTRFLRRAAVAALVILPMLAGCAGSGCEFLAYEGPLPEETPPLVMPAGVPAPAERGEFQVQEVATAPPSGKCVAEPPMTLPPEKLEAPAEDEKAEAA